jgi:hypothetical protein
MNPRTKLLSVVALAVALGACTGGGQGLSLAPASETYYFRGFATVDVDYLSRYACADPHLLLKCKRTSRLERTCDCWC